MCQRRECREFHDSRQCNELHECYVSHKRRECHECQESGRESCIMSGKS